MTWLLYLFHVLVCVFLIGVVLLQSGKAADLAGAFGGGGSQTALGSRGAATVLSKATTIAAVVFMLTSLGLALLAARQGGSVLESAPVPAEGPAGAGGLGAAPEPAPEPVEEGSTPAAAEEAPVEDESTPEPE
ncbi:MAG: preprotein translocase subunit SecG [Acidobacteriota bacterium]